jgi:hypothetical protein
MVVVLIALTIGTLLSLARSPRRPPATFPAARKSQDRKAAYAAAESGLAYFNFRLNQNYVYWKDVRRQQQRTGAPNRVQAGARTSQGYVIEFLPANGASKCRPEHPDHDDDRPHDGDLPHSRPPAARAYVYRTIVAAYHRKTFLDYLWYTTSEAGDPAIFSGTTTECLKPRAIAFGLHRDQLRRRGRGQGSDAHRRHLPGVQQPALRSRPHPVQLPGQRPDRVLRPRARL